MTWIVLAIIVISLVALFALRVSRSGTIADSSSRRSHDGSGSTHGGTWAHTSTSNGYGSSSRDGYDGGSSSGADSTPSGSDSGGSSGGGDSGGGGGGGDGGSS